APVSQPVCCSSVDGEHDDGGALLHVDQLVLVMDLDQCATDVRAVAARHGDVLLATGGGRNDPAVVRRPVVEPPQHVTPLRVQRLDEAADGSDQDQTAA